MTQKTLTPYTDIRDNHHCGKVADFLTEKIAKGSQLSVVSAYFTIYAYEALKTQLEQIHQTANAPDHPIRNCLLRLSADSPELLAIIKEKGTI